MLCLKDCSTADGILHNFNFQQEAGTSHIILSKNTVILDEIQDFLSRKSYRGTAILHGKDLFSQRVAFLARTTSNYQNQTVLENVFDDLSFFQIHRKKTRQKFLQLLEETGISIDMNLKVSELSVNDCMVVKILRCYYHVPDFMLIRELGNSLSFDTYRTAVKLLRKLNQKGTTILYLTNRIEEIVQLKCSVSIISNHGSLKTFTSEEVAMDLNHIYNELRDDRASDLVDEDMDQILFSLQKLNRKDGKKENITEWHEMLKLFSQYLLHELSPSSVVIYLITHGRKNLSQDIQVEYVSSEKRKMDHAPVLEKYAMIKMLSESNLILKNNESVDFTSMFSTKEIPVSILCYSMKVSEEISLLVQVNYDKKLYIFTKKESVMMRWVAKEISVYLENSRLMGNSILLRESHHRIKNNLQIIISLLEMEKVNLPGQSGKSDFMNKVDQIFDEAINRVKCIAEIHDLLAQNQSHASSCEIETITGKICDFYRGYSSINVSADSILVPYSKAVSIALVMNELISNSIKHNEHTGKKLNILISITKNKQNGCIQIICRDNGAGFTKETSHARFSSGVGQRIIESIVLYEFRGKIEKYNDSGAVIKINLPEKSLLPLEKREVENL